MGHSPSDPLAEALNRLWAKHLAQMQERVERLRKAAEDLANGLLNQSEQQQAAAEAHKLAGVLGTFGLKEGSELAREAEVLYESPLDGNTAAASRLATIAADLQALIAGRNQKA